MTNLSHLEKMGDVIFKIRKEGPCMKVEVEGMENDIASAIAIAMYKDPIIMKIIKIALYGYEQTQTVFENKN